MTGQRRVDLGRGEQLHLAAEVVLHRHVGRPPARQPPGPVEPEVAALAEAELLAVLGEEVDRRRAQLHVDRAATRWRARRRRSAPTTTARRPGRGRPPPRRRAPHLGQVHGHGAPGEPRAHDQRPRLASIAAPSAGRAASAEGPRRAGGRRAGRGRGGREKEGGGEGAGGLEIRSGNADHGPRDHLLAPRPRPAPRRPRRGPARPSCRRGAAAAQAATVTVAPGDIAERASPPATARASPPSPRPTASPTRT